MFGKFMNKKFFHPSSYPNQKQKWIHQQRADAKVKLENEKQETYMKEQESYQSRLLSAKSKEEKMKLDLNFLYDVPPGMKKDNENEEEEAEVKFEWQKHAPRSKYVKDLGLECQDQPFGICVKNIRCFKCRQWGHQNTDRECPLFFSNMPSSGSSGKSQADSLRLSDPLRLIADMKKQHGITLKKSVIGQEIDPMAEHNQLLESDGEQDQGGENNLFDKDLKYIASLSNKEKKKLLKTLNKFEKSVKKKNKKKKRKRDSGHSSDEEYWSESDKKQTTSEIHSFSDEDIKKRKKRKIARNDGDSHYHDRKQSRKESRSLPHRDSKRSKESKHTSSKSQRTKTRNDNVSRIISECRTSSKK